MRKMMIMMVAALALAGCSSANDETGGSDSELTLPPTSTAADVQVSCRPASSGDVAAIERSLAGQASQLGPAFTYDRGEMRMVVADILDAGGEKLSSWDSWVLINGTPTARSSSANDYSDLPDTDDLIKPWELDSELGESAPGVEYAIGETCLLGAKVPTTSATPTSTSVATTTSPPTTIAPPPTTERPRLSSNPPAGLNLPNCSDYAAQGYADIPSSSPVYRTDLDPDYDGIACEQGF